jgi:hypothetical protein
LVNENADANRIETTSLNPFDVFALTHLAIPT